MNIFLDTNIFLSFYHLSSDDLEELKKLAVLARKGKIKIYLPEQVVNEFRRNRANKISDAIKRLREQSINLQLPQLSKKYKEYDKLRKVYKEYVKYHGKLIECIEEDTISNNLAADDVIEKLFNVLESIPTSQEQIAKSRLRIDLGNPPGKKGSLGDALNWEVLLETVPDGEELYFITDDTDFFSPLDPNSLDPYLEQEWSDCKSSNIHLYKRLSTFFQDHFPDIELAIELEKDLLIKDLAGASNFENTHKAISKLSRFIDFTQAQINEIIAAAISNNQIYWIARYPDVHNFLASVVKGREDQIDPDSLWRIKYVLEELEPYGEIPPF